MNKPILYIYDLFKRHPWSGWSIFALLTVGLLFSLFSLSYQEDISAFLPMDEKNQTALAVYQNISGADNIYAIVSTKDTTDSDPQQLVDGIESFVSAVNDLDSLHLVGNITKEIDIDKITGIADSVYQNIPYYLNESDYTRIDSLMNIPDYIETCVEEDKQLLLFPTSGMISSNIGRDPLNLFTPVTGRLKHAGTDINFDTYDGYILSPDGKKAIAIVQSSFGAQESDNNGHLMALLNDAADVAIRDNANLDIHLIGGPAVAVSNADRIKKDSILAISIAGVLILSLLIYVFRNLRNILLIIVSVGWGWLFAMGAIALYYDSVSIIVIGIASVILGIAINYPLHLIDHLKNSDNPKRALGEIISPLVVGNITTVGAFLCLVPLNAPALHDLGLFSSLLLIGTILFVLFFLPHLVRTRRVGAPSMKDPVLITRIANVSPDNNRYVVWSVLLLTVVFAYFSTKTEFDTDMRHINYMTDEQKADFAYFESLANEHTGNEDLYVVSCGSDWNKALEQNAMINADIDSLVSADMASRKSHVSDFLVTKDEQKRRLAQWDAMISRYHDRFTASLKQAAAKQGFSPDAFAEFDNLINKKYSIRDFENFQGVISTAFAGSTGVNAENGNKYIVQILSVHPENIEAAKQKLSANKEFGGLFFDVRSMNASIADTLSDDFNYIGFACGCIVFIFLWISLGSLELAIVSFLPMAFSWIWILGIMGMLGLKFNIVNIILATFIFGQGDDYTIFITEGLSYELAYRKKLLASYKNSIIVSALVMFIGIGTLLFAKHPAMRSLGEVTVVGMISVVLMAYLFPPLIFNRLVRYKNGQLRLRPLTLKRIVSNAVGCTSLLFKVSVARLSGRPIRPLPDVIIRFTGAKDIKTPVMIVCNHFSMVNILSVLSVMPRTIVILDNRFIHNRFIRTTIRWTKTIAINRDSADVKSKVQSYVADGYNILAFPWHNHSSRIDSLPFNIAQESKMKILPLYAVSILSDFHDRDVHCSDAMLNQGLTYLVAVRQISSGISENGNNFESILESMYNTFQSRLNELRRELFSVKDFCSVVYERYLYKGHDIEVSARRTLHRIALQKAVVDEEEINTQGEFTLVNAIMYPDKEIQCCGLSSESIEILRGCADGFAPNIHIDSPCR